MHGVKHCLLIFSFCEHKVHYYYYYYYKHTHKEHGCISRYSVRECMHDRTLTHSQRIFASLQYAGATARSKHCRHIESANRKWSYNIHGRPIVFNLTRENE